MPEQTAEGEGEMSKGRVVALCMLAVLMIVLLFNKGRVDVNILFDTIEPLKSLAFLSFTAVGVVIGILLK
jgi:uncharacterized integral membrane protein